MVLDLTVEALGKVGDKGATPRLVALLSDPSAQLRGEAAFAMWRLADSTAIGALLAHMEDADPGVRWRVMYALEKVLAPDRVVLRVAQRLTDPEWLTRAYAVRTLGRQKSPRATAYVLQMLADPEVPVVVNALRALQSIADSSGSFELRAISGALRHPHPYVRLCAATALGDRFAWVRADSSSRRVAIDSLLVHLRDPDAATRGACVKALASQHALSQGNARGMLHDPSPYTCAATLEALEMVGLKEGLPLVLPRLAPGSPEIVRMTAADVLGKLEGHFGDSRAPRRAQRQLGAGRFRRRRRARRDGRYGERFGSRRPRMPRTDWMPLPDARQAIRDALHTLGGAAIADSLERAHPGPAKATEYADDFGCRPRNTARCSTPPPATSSGRSTAARRRRR